MSKVLLKTGILTKVEILCNPGFSYDNMKNVLSNIIFPRPLKGLSYDRIQCKS